MRDFALGSLLLVLVSCQGRSEGGTPGPQAQPAAISVGDRFDVVVTRAAPAQRIVSLSPALTEILFAVGCGGQVVLRDRRADYPPEVRQLPATDGFQIAVEHIAGFTPDLILLGPTGAAVRAAFDRLGLPVASFDPQRIGDLLDDLERIGALCGRAAAARQLAQKMRARLTRVTSQVSGLTRPTVYVELDGSNPMRPWTAGAGSFLHDLLTLAGARNAMGDLRQGYVAVSVEHIWRVDPDIILRLPTEEATLVGRRLSDRPGWRALRAVRQGRIIASIPEALLVRPGPRVIDGLEQLAAAIHPQVLTRSMR